MSEISKSIYDRVIFHGRSSNSVLNGRGSPSIDHGRDAGPPRYLILIIFIARWDSRAFAAPGATTWLVILGSLATRTLNADSSGTPVAGSRRQTPGFTCKTTDSTAISSSEGSLILRVHAATTTTLSRKELDLTICQMFQF